jgi:hypothetical protein
MTVIHFKFLCSVSRDVTTKDISGKKVSKKNLKG